MRTAPIALLVAAVALLELVPATASAAPVGGSVRDVIVAVSGTVPSEVRRTPAKVRSLKAEIRSQARSLGVIPIDTYAGDSRFFTARVTAAQRARLERDPKVLTVIEDEFIEDDSGPVASDSKVIGRPAREQLRRQVTPTWLKRIGVTSIDRKLGKGKQRRAFDADIAIIDSGISPNHPDVRPAGGKDCTHSGGWGDGYGHGLGVASILGARDNGRGTVGILPGVRLWSVRIFDKHGRTRLSWVLCGLDWVANKRDRKDRKRPFFEGATLSFSIGEASGRPIPNGSCGRRPIDLIHQAICRIERQGTILVAAAGNYGQKAAKRRPAGYQEVITVSAMADFDGKPGGKGSQSKACHAGSAPERDDRFTTFSSWGVGVDLIAPGKCIWVAFRGKTYARVSGTSFAAPMVLGAALLYRKRYPSAGPQQVRQALVRAGRKDWRVGSDPDRSHEPRVDVRHFRPPPTFSYRELGRRSLRQAGDALTVSLRPRRKYGHTARITLRKVDVPKGIRVRIDGSKVIIQARSTAKSGKRSVVIRASDGEVRRTIRIPIRVKDR
jgi:subtilisin